MTKLFISSYYNTIAFYLTLSKYFLYNVIVKFNKGGCMSVMFWVWLGILVGSAIIELATMEVVSIWFTVGSIIPFILAGCLGNYLWELQVALFIVLSALCIIFLRRLTKKFLLKNANEKTNLDAVIGKKVRLLENTDFETLGAVKLNDVVWTAVSENGEEIKKGQIVEIVSVKGNKLIVKLAEKEKRIDIQNEKIKTTEIKEGGKD